MRALALPVLLLAAALAGCLTTSQPPPAPLPAAVGFDGLDAADAVEVVDAAATRTFVFEGQAGTGARGILVPLPPQATWTLPLAFEVDRRVGYVELNLTWDFATGLGESNLNAFARDPWGRIQCGATSFATTKRCTAPVPSNTTEAATWTAEVTTAFPFSMQGAPWRLEVTLHPPAHMTRGDPLAGVDPAIRFRVADTEVDAAEPNVGLLADGTIFAQNGLATMRSRDDGLTWENVAPPTTSQRTLDPMLRVEPYSGVVYVDQLYVGCSVLAWSGDGGDTWLSNPAACGMPANDHQKLAAGPNPIPGSPFNAVYYSFSSFAQGVWASRSLDGGVTWTTSPVVGVGDGRSYANTGPIEADREGNVYIPLYMCDGEGYIGAGVSRDYGATWEFVVVSDEPGPCYDVDPGLAIDTDGTVYVAYHRPTGVKYASSADRGATWSAPVQVSPPSLLSFVHVDAVAGDPGKLAIAYRATPDTAKGPDEADGWAAWYMYVSFVEGADAAQPLVRTGIVSPPGDPEQRGPICTLGVACAGGSRNLLDFIDIGVGPDGRVYPIYADGCWEGCETPADSRVRGHGPVGVQVEGPRLFAAGAPWAAGAAGVAGLHALGSP